MQKQSAFVAILLLCFTCVSAQAKKLNVLLICVDDLRPELQCYGVDYIQSPNIDRLASDGHLFLNHYVQAPTCGASRNALLTGQFGGASNGALFQRAKKIAGGENVTPSLPAWFRSNGYTTVSVGKVSHHPGGRGGGDWDDQDQLEMPNSWDRHLLPAGKWMHPRGWMHGLANGEIRIKAGEMDVFQSIAGHDSIYPDGPSTDEALRQLGLLCQDDEKPFFLAFGILRPHLPFGAPAKYMDHYRDVVLPPIPNPSKPAFRTTWHGSGEFMKYNRWKRNPNVDHEFANQVRKHYAACVSYADQQVGKVLSHLKRKGQLDNTIVVLWGDHGWHLGEHGIWGKHSLFEESLRSPLIIRMSKAKNVGTSVNQIVESVDVFPTLCQLAELPVPDFVDGESLVSIVGSKNDVRTQEENAVEPSAVSYFRSAKTIRTKRYRLITHNDGYVELYDHKNDDGENQNVAPSKPKVVERLKSLLSKRLE